MEEFISGEFRAKEIPPKFEPELPKVMAEGAVEIADELTPELGKQIESQDIDSLMEKLEELDDNIKKLHAQIGVYQGFLKQYADNKDLLAKLNEESRDLRDKYDHFLAERDTLSSQLKQRN